MLGSTILAVSVLAFTAYYLLTVVSDTAAGTDEVRWPGELMIDWLGQSLRLFGMVAIILVPAGILVRALAESYPSQHKGFWILALIMSWLWLVFPIALLSSMSASSLFVVFRPAIARDLLRIFPRALLFYILSAIGLCAFALSWFAVLLGGQALLIPLAALLSSWLILVYARLLGRLGWVIAQTKSPARKRPAGKLKPSQRKRIEVSDPWNAPAAVKKAISSPVRQDKSPSPEEAESYGLSDEPPCLPPLFELIPGSPFLDVKLRPAVPTPPREQLPKEPANIFVDEEAGEEIKLTPAEKSSVETRPRLDVTPSPLEMRLYAEREASDAPSFPMFSGVYSFPFYG
ncbi:MAG: hypothetical protein ACRD36_06090, partial [Candidatus Acidiferrum sp.]